MGDVIFASTPSKSHARGVASILHRGLTADASLSASSGVSQGMREVKAVASVSWNSVFRLRVQPPILRNLAIQPFTSWSKSIVAIKVIDALYQLNEARNLRINHKKIKKVVGRSTNLHISNITSNDEDRLSRLNETCTFGGAISFPPGEDLRQVKEEIENTVTNVAENDEWLKINQPKISWISGVTGAEVDESSLFYQIVSSATKNVTGKMPHVNPMHTSSDIRNPIVEANIPCVGLGCLGGNLSQNNKIDEWIDIKDFYRMVEVTSEIIERWCSGEQKIDRTVY